MEIPSCAMFHARKINLHNDGEKCSAMSQVYDVRRLTNRVSNAIFVHLHRHVSLLLCIIR